MDIEIKKDNHSDWYAKVNPNMTVPTLKYDDEIITDSREIL